MAYHLEKRWKKLYNSSLVRAQSLEPIKKKFAEITSVEIKTFSIDVCYTQYNWVFWIKYKSCIRQLLEFVKKFELEGPGAVDADLDKGIKLMEQYGHLFDELEVQRLELGKIVLFLHLYTMQTHIEHSIQFS